MLTRPRTHTERRLVADDGAILGARIYPALGPARATVIIHGATAVPQRYYARFAEHLAKGGLRVVTYDYRGVGASRPASLRGYRARMLDWATDARAALALAEEGGLPVVWIGHSFGGQLLGLVDEARRAAGAILIGAQLGFAGDWPARMQPRIRLFWHVLVPALTRTLGYYPGKIGLGEDLPAGVAREWRRWALHPEYYLGEQPDARARLARFDRPTLSFGFSDDDFAPEATVTRLLGHLSGARILDRRLTPADLGVAKVGHFGAFRPEHQDTVWRDVGAFIDHIIDGAELPPELSPKGDPSFTAEELERDLWMRDARA